jgi:hypothetical protein
MGRSYNQELWVVDGKAHLERVGGLMKLVPCFEEIVGDVDSA